jgi:hypothetical protein
MYLFRLPSYFRYLDESVYTFVCELNGMDEDMELANTNESSMNMNLNPGQISSLNQ